MSDMFVAINKALPRAWKFENAPVVFSGFSISPFTGVGKVSVAPLNLGIGGREYPVEGAGSAYRNRLSAGDQTLVMSSVDPSTNMAISFGRSPFVSG